MEELIRILTSWRGKEKPKPKPPRKPPAGPGKPRYPAGATEAEKLQIAKDRIRAQREAAEGGKPRDPGGPFGELPTKIGIGVKRIAGEKPKEGAKKPWYSRGLYDVFGK